MNMVNDETVVKVSPQGTGQGPGQRLASARQALNLTVEHVAAQLRLTKRCITDLEDDNYATGIPLTFIRGYLRGYARMVDVPEDEVIQCFNALGIPDDSEQEYVSRTYNKTLISLKPQRNWKIKSYQVILLIVGLAIVLGIFTWWRVSLPVQRMGIETYPSTQINSLQDESHIDISQGAESDSFVIEPLEVESIEIQPSENATAE